LAAGGALLAGGGLAALIAGGALAVTAAALGAGTTAATLVPALVAADSVAFWTLSVPGFRLRTSAGQGLLAATGARRREGGERRGGRVPRPRAPAGRWPADFARATSRECCRDGP